MFIGEYTHTLDPKNRVSLPAKFRKELGRAVILTRGLDRCLFIYSKRAWEGIAAKFAALSLGQADTRGVSRFMLSGALEAEVDSAGRVLIPDYLKAFAGLRAKVVLAGVNERVELWDHDAWRGYTASIERDADKLAEKLGEVGSL